MLNSSPTKQELLEVFQRIATILTEVASNNDNVINQTDNLKIILFNLQIESAHISQANGIKPIAIELQKITNDLHARTKETIRNRQKLIDGLTKIQNYIINIEE